MRVTSLDFSKQIESRHQDVIRTIKRFKSHGFTNEDIEDGFFTNSMNRDYKMYYISDKIYNMLEAVYIYGGFGESKKADTLKNSYGVDYVYLITDNNGLTKIGTTKNIKSRLCTLQTSSAQFLELLAYTRGGKLLESKLHARFADKNINGEWFRLSEDDIYSICKIDTNPIHCNIWNITNTLKNTAFEVENMIIDEAYSFPTERCLKEFKYPVLRKIRQSLVGIVESNNKIKEQVNQLVDSLSFKQIK